MEATFFCTWGWWLSVLCFWIPYLIGMWRWLGCGDYWEKRVEMGDFLMGGRRSDLQLLPPCRFWKYHNYPHQRNVMIKECIETTWNGLKNIVIRLVYMWMILHIVFWNRVLTFLEISFIINSSANDSGKTLLKTCWKLC